MEQQPTPKKELTAFLDSIPAGDVEKFVDKLIGDAKTNRTIFRNWRLGLTKIPILERSVMNETATKVYNRKIFSDEPTSCTKTE